MKKEALLYKKIENKNVSCFLCSHQCQIENSKFGICRVRQNINGKLYSLIYGKAIAARSDPIEKKPLYHFLPGSQSFSIATMGCNFKCDFCQNWRISQINNKKKLNTNNNKLLPEGIISNAINQNCKSISYTYTEPTIFFEYAYDSAILSKERGLSNVFVTNGFISKQAIETIGPFLDAANIDLKFFKEESYKRMCKGKLQPVLNSIELFKKKGIWIEITTLIIPGLNDSEEELKNIAKFIANTGNEIPWHISRFHPTYNYTNSESTPKETLLKAKQIGKTAGLKYIYMGNISAAKNNTYCNNCNKLLIKRDFFNTTQNNIKENKCPECGNEIAGVWD